jgi:SAM-dependent methyltransferase
VPNPNAYSRRWFSTFLGRIDATIVEREVAFLARQLPMPAFQSVVDLCCGTGRHLVPLSEAGYGVTGIDRDTVALDMARRSTSSRAKAHLVRGDMRALPIADASCDAVICMWQSFGQFDAMANRDVLKDIRRVLRSRGRFVLDVYHREFHQQRLGQRLLVRDGTRVTEGRTMMGRRLQVVLEYQEAADGLDERETDTFEWELFTPDELAAEARSAGLQLLKACATFDETRVPTPEEARMQLVFEARDIGRRV